jgi:hypothetical protein
MALYIYHSSGSRRKRRQAGAGLKSIAGPAGGRMHNTGFGKGRALASFSSFPLTGNSERGKVGGDNGGSLSGARFKGGPVQASGELQGRTFNRVRMRVCGNES